MLDDLGLEPALTALTQEFARRTGIHVDQEIELAGGVVPEVVQVAIYRIVQEALTNVARHSGAKRVIVKAALRDRVIEIAIEDNGRGAVAAPTPHMGLLGMRERVTELGGRFRVVTRPQEGFRIEATLPQETA